MQGQMEKCFFYFLLFVEGELRIANACISTEIIHKVRFSGGIVFLDHGDGNVETTVIIYK